MSILGWILSQIFSLKAIIKITVSGVFGFLTVLALLTFFSAEMNQGVMANFFARVLVFTIFFVVFYMLLTLLIRGLR